jgi:hypothetical protein
MIALRSLVFAVVASAAFAGETCAADGCKNPDAHVLLQSTIEQYVEIQEHFESDPAPASQDDAKKLTQKLMKQVQDGASAEEIAKTNKQLQAAAYAGLSPAQKKKFDEGKEKVKKVMAKAAAEAKVAEEYGDNNCPCVGIDDLEGKTTVHIGNKTKDQKADVGASCKAWEDGWHPSCKGDKPPAWCKQKWCYVDPCNCKKVNDVPKPSSYLPDAKYIGKPLHYSYATCGASDSWTSDKKRKALKHVKETCAVKVDSSKWGQEDCRCVGIGPQPGTTTVTLAKGKTDYSASTGAFCHKWEEKQHPSCKGKGDKAPKWCSQAWCYVDPCKCKSATPPKTSSYLPDANYQGKPVYYSYATCGGADHFSAGDKKACVNKKTKEECATLDKCAWNGKDCLGKDLVKTCNKAVEDKKVAEEADKEVKKDVEKATKKVKEEIKNEAFAPKVLAAVTLSMLVFLQ